MNELWKWNEIAGRHCGPIYVNGHGFKVCDCGSRQAAGWKQSGGGGKKGVEREVGGRREAMKCGLIQGNRKKYRETIQSHLVLKEWDGDEGQCKGLGFNGSPVDFLGKVDHLCKNRHDDCSA